MSKHLAFAMKNSVLPLVCVAAAVALRPSSASMSAAPSVNQPSLSVRYFQQDTDSDVQTESESDSDSDGNYDVFYDRLSQDGRWFNTDDYGYVWQPNVAVSTASWRPYSDGHWVWTDRGWFWDSNENFGWATYHYGRWNDVDGVGWVWVPGQRWAPAWVSWRHTDDDDYVGWAPLPAESTFSVHVGVHPWADSYYGIGPAAYAFIRIGDFCRPSYQEFCIPPQQNLTIINRTTNITNITYANNVIVNNGPQYQRVSQLVQQRAGQQVPNYRINYAAQTQANAAFKTSAQGNQLNVLAPPASLRPVATTKPQVARELGKAQINRGWKNVPETQANQLRQQFAQQTPVPKELPAKPVLPAKPQIQEVTKGEQHPANEPGKGQPAPNGQPAPKVQPAQNGQPASKVQPAQNGQPASKAQPAQNGQPEPKVQPAQNGQPVPKVQPAQNGQPAPKVQPAQNGQPAPKVQPAQNNQPPPNGDLKPFVEKPQNKATGEQQRSETEKPKPVQPETVKPAEPPKRPAVTEEKRPGNEAIPTERPKTNEVRRNEGQQPQQNQETKHAPEAPKPASRQEAPKRNKEDTKKEPTAPPQSRAKSPEQPQALSQPRVTETRSAQQPHPAPVHVAQLHPAEPHVAQASHPKANLAPEGHRIASNNSGQKKDERKE
jgi:hypothetical protein